jgi:hypothetical protein
VHRTHQIHTLFTPIFLLRWSHNPVIQWYGISVQQVMSPGLHMHIKKSLSGGCRLRYGASRSAEGRRESPLTISPKDIRASKAHSDEQGRRGPSPWHAISPKDTRASKAHSDEQGRRGPSPWHEISPKDIRASKAHSDEQGRRGPSPWHKISPKDTRASKAHSLLLQPDNRLRRYAYDQT